MKRFSVDKPDAGDGARVSLGAAGGTADAEFDDVGGDDEVGFVPIV